MQLNCQKRVKCNVPIRLSRILGSIFQSFGPQLTGTDVEIINGDNSFTFLLFVPSSGSEVRIVGNKNGKKVKELMFKVRVGK